ncbi:MAG: hypothetical protein IJ460_02695 [Clostridia bacterium]|nr:hypothetical protein [Clostridia bacterium]
MAHQLREGEFACWLWQDENNSRELGINEYGCADAANLLYTIGEFPSSAENRSKWISALQGLQNPDNGLFTEATHHPIHTTAHCIAALELFDVKPLYPLNGLSQYATPEGLIGLLESLDWVGDPWDMSHRGAGIYAAMKLSGSVDDKWCETYFDWLWENADEKTGFWRKGAVDGDSPYVAHMAGTFHYLFNHEYARKPLRYPDKVIDTCLELYTKNDLTADFGRRFGFAEVDWVYCITRASRQTPHRYEECRKALISFAKDYIDYINSIDAMTDDGFNDLHGLFGTSCCLAELQQALPGMIRSSKPLKLVLDRRPFI